MELSMIKEYRNLDYIYPFLLQYSIINVNSKRRESMDIRWKDDNGNILNVNNEKFKYLDATENVKTILTKEEVKKSQ